MLRKINLNFSQIFTVSLLLLATSSPILAISCPDVLQNPYPSTTSSITVAGVSVIGGTYPAGTTVRHCGTTGSSTWASGAQMYLKLIGGGNYGLYNGYYEKAPCIDIVLNTPGTYYGVNHLWYYSGTHEGVCTYFANPPGYTACSRPACAPRTGCSTSGMSSPCYQATAKYSLGITTGTFTIVYAPPTPTPTPIPPTPTWTPTPTPIPPTPTWTPTPTPTPTPIPPTPTWTPTPTPTPTPIPPTPTWTPTPTPIPPTPTWTPTPTPTPTSIPPTSIPPTPTWTPTPPQTLSVDLTASLTSLFWQQALSGNAPLNNIDLQATISGSATGTINYTFYCNRFDAGTHITSGYDAKFDGVSDYITTWTETDLCDFPTTGTYSLKVIAERGTAPPAEDRVTVTVGTPPTATPTPTPTATPTLAPPTATPTNTPTPTPTPTPLPFAQFTGRLYKDNDADCTFTLGDTDVTGTIDINQSTPATPTCPAFSTLGRSVNGNFSVMGTNCYSVVLSANYAFTLRYTDTDVNLYRFACGVETGPAAGLTVSRSFTIGGTAPTAINGALHLVNNDWLQCFGGDIHASSINNQIPALATNKAFVRSNETNPMVATGIVSSGTTAKLGNGIQPWLATSYPQNLSAETEFNNLTRKIIGANKVDTTYVNGTSLTAASLVNTNGDDVSIIRISGNAIITDLTGYNSKSIIIVEGDLIIIGNISLGTNGFFLALTSGSIVVGNSLGTTHNDESTIQLEGAFVAGTNFDAGGGTKRLNIKGSVVTGANGAGSYVSNRSYGAENETSPSDYIIFNPKLILNVPNVLAEPIYSWTEIQN